jgi:hypothetical protein
MGHISVKLEKGKYRLEQVSDAQSVSPDDPFIQALAREVCIGQHELVAVAHPGHHLKQLRRDQGRNTFKHKLYFTASEISLFRTKINTFSPHQ